jgi:hypothetical protein
MPSALGLDELEPISATPDPELPAPRDEDATLPDSPPRKPQQLESSAGGGEQVEATNATPADGTGKCLTPCG